MIAAAPPSPRRTLIDRLSSAGWVAFALLLVCAFGAAAVGLTSGHPYNDEGYDFPAHDSSAAEGLALFLLVTRVLPWAVVTGACGVFLRGWFRSIGLLALSIPAWAWNALVVYRWATWPESRQGWPEDLILLAPGFVVTGAAWASRPNRRSQ